LVEIENARAGEGREVDVPGEEAVPKTERSHPLLWAIVDFRETLERLIEDQKELILSRGTEPVTSEPPPTPHGFAAPIAVTPPAIPAPVPPMSVARTCARDVAPPPKSAAPAPIDAPDDQAPADPDPAGQTEDPRKRLDALAKLLDRRLKQTTPGSVEPSARRGKG
jgi:hypothetical protein